MDHRLLRDMAVQLESQPNFFLTNDGRSFLIDDQPLESETGPSVMAYVVLGAGIVLFSWFMYRINNGGEPPGVPMLAVGLVGLVGLAIGGIWTYAERASEPVIRTSTHVVSASVVDKEFMGNAGIWQVKANYTCPDTGTLKQTSFAVPDRRNEEVVVGETNIAVLYSPQFMRGKAI